MGVVSHVSMDSSEKKIIFKHRPQVSLSFKYIFTMERFVIAYYAYEDSVKSLIDNLDISQDALSEVRDRINNGFEYLSDEQDAISTKNCVIDVNGYEIMCINTGGS